MLPSHRRLITLALATPLAVGLAHAAPAGAAAGVDVDNSQIDALAQSVYDHPTTFGGISLDTDGTLVVRYAGAAGQASAKTTLARHTSIRVDGGRRSRVRFVEVKHSTKDLDAVREQVRSDPTLKKVISEHFVDVQRNTVSVGVTQVTPEVTQAVRARFGQLVELHAAALATRASRTSDWEPWGGGIRINSGAVGCTAGYVIHNTLSITPTRQLVTAGHCGPQGTTWYNNGVRVGSMKHSELTEGGLDYARIGDSTYMAVTYTGPSDSTTWVSVKGTDTPVIGKQYCTNGATSGEVCWATVGAVNACVRFDDGITTCHLDIMWHSAWQTIVRPGDSGGAVIRYASGLRIGGLIVGGDIGGSRAYFHSTHTLHGSPPIVAIWQVATR